MKFHLLLLSQLFLVINLSISQEVDDRDSIRRTGILKKAPLLVALNTLSMVSIGVFKWDWGSNRFAFRNEGYFGENTTNGGADKAGHLWSTYTLSNINMHFLQKEGVENYKEYGILLAWANMLVVELGDGISKTYGFSKEDLLFN